MTEVKIDQDKALNYEYNSLFKKIGNLFLIPILNNIPARLRKYIRSSHESADEIIEHATTHHALEILYHRGHPHRNKSFKHKFFHFIWFNTLNSKGVRNRLRLVRREIEIFLKEETNRNKLVSILNIAAGSARAVVESIEALGEKSSLVSAIFLDKNPRAIEYSQKLASELLGDIQNISWRNETVGNFFENQIENQFDLVEMVGLLDYFSEKKAVETLKSIYQSLKPDGILITANITDNAERKFVTNAIGWKMIYRAPKEFSQLIISAGFSEDQIKVFLEPLKVHIVIVARK